MPHVNSLGFVKFIDYNILTVSDINRSSGCRHHAAMSPERRDSEGESRRDLAVGERSVTHGMNRKEIMRLKDANYYNNYVIL